MKKIENQKFSIPGDELCKLLKGGLEDSDSNRPTQIENVELINCSTGCESIVTHGSPDERSCVRNVHIKNCKFHGFDAYGAIFDEVVVDTCRNYHIMLFNACAFRHVTVKGRFGRALFNHDRDFEDVSLVDEFGRGVDSFDVKSETFARV